MKIKLYGKRLSPTDSVKCLGVKTDSKLNWKSHVNAIATKLNRANAMLYKVRDFVNANILKSIYYALFESHINYACIIWGQNITTIKHLYILQKKALRIINFKECNVHSVPLFHYSKIIKITDKVKIENCLFIHKYTNKKFILFPEMCAITCACVGTHASKFTCAVYHTREIIVFSHKEKFFIEGFSIEYN